MPHTRPQRPRHRRTGPAKASGCRQLIRVDSTPLRNHARREYDKARKALVKAQAELDRFHSQDQPLYQQWLTEHFGQLLTKLRELRDQIAEAEALISTVQSRVLFTGCSYQRAYREATEPSAEPSEPSPEPETGPESDPVFEEYARMFDDFFDGNEFFNRFRQQPPTAPKRPAASRLKELYRTVVRLLHPDKNRDLTPQEKEWWHEAQAAYQKQDEAQLELVLTLCELSRKNHDTGAAPLSLLRRVVEQIKSSLRQVRRQLRRCRQDPAWEFSAGTNRELLHHQVQRTLEEDFVRAREMHSRYQAIIERWKRNPRPRTRRNRRHTPEWF